MIQGQASSMSPAASKENEVGEVNLNKAPPLPPGAGNMKAKHHKDKNSLKGKPRK